MSYLSKPFSVTIFIHTFQREQALVVSILILRIYGLSALAWPDTFEYFY